MTVDGSKFPKLPKIEGKRYFTTSEVARIFAVDVTTVRRWTVHKKITCSQTGGGHRQFEIKEILRFAKANGYERITKSNLKAGDEKQDIENSLAVGDTPALGQRFLELAADPGEMTPLGYLEQLHITGVTLNDLFDRVLSSVVSQITLPAEGNLSATDRLTLNQLELTLANLSQAFPVARKHKGTALVGTPPGERHDLVARMVNAFLTIQGIRVLPFWPQNTLESWREVIATRQIDWILLGVSTFPLSQETTLFRTALEKAIPKSGKATKVVFVAPKDLLMLSSTGTKEALTFQKLSRLISEPR